jgi:Flp pilus assembly pilin Flp
MENETETTAEMESNSRWQAYKSAMAGENPHRAIMRDKNGVTLFDVSLAMGLGAVGLLALWSPTLLIIAGILTFLTKSTVSIETA